MCDKFVSEDSSMPKYYLDGYKTQEMGDKSVDVDAFLSTLKFIPDWIVTKKWLKNLMMFILWWWYNLC